MQSIIVKLLQWLDSSDLKQAYRKSKTKHSKRKTNLNILYTCGAGSVENIQEDVKSFQCNEDITYVKMF